MVGTGVHNQRRICCNEKMVTLDSPTQMQSHGSLMGVWVRTGSPITETRMFTLTVQGNARSVLSTDCRTQVGRRNRS